MKKILLSALFILSALAFVRAQAVSINTDASNPDPSAILDVKSTEKGMLVPRMTTAQRTLIAAPATGLLVFDTTTGGFWFFNGTVWTNLSGGGAPATFIADTDGNTKVQTEKAPNEDVIRFDLGGTEKMLLRKNIYGAARLELPDAAYTTSIGVGAGAGNIPALDSGGEENTFLGYLAGNANSYGNFNTFLGSQAGKNTTTGFSNTASGKNALYFNTIGSNNTAVGKNALYSNSTGGNNTASGVSALYSNSTGNYNTANGFNALYSNAAGNSNTAIGKDALYRNTDRSNLVAVGDSALYNNGTGAMESYQAIENTALGSKALYSNTTGHDNTANGYQALFSNTTGFFSTANGNQALFSNTTGFDNTANGSAALYFNTTGYANTAYGVNALHFNTTGSANTAVGAFANVTTGALLNATAIGREAVVNASNKVVIGRNTAGIVIGGYANWSNLSDGRFKENIRENVPGLDFISRLRPVTYWINTDKLQRHITAEMPDSIAQRYLPDAQQQAKDREHSHTGFVAQEVEAVARQIGYAFDGVNAPKNLTDNYSIAYSQFVPSLVKAVQEQQTLIEAQTGKIEAQQAEIELLKKQAAETATLRAQLDKITAALQTAGIGVGN
jgi:hypothetical protein